MLITCLLHIDKWIEKLNYKNKTMAYIIAFVETGILTIYLIKDMFSVESIFTEFKFQFAALWIQSKY